MMLSLSGATGSDFSIYAGMPPIMPWQTAASSRLMSRQRPRVVGGSNVIATYNIASYNVIRRPAQTPARTRNALRCHWGLWDALSARGLNRKRHPVLSVESGTQFPFGDRSGKCIPFWSQILGRSFRQACHPESASRSEPEFWDELSTEASTGKCIPFRGLILGCTFRGETTVFRKSTRPETYQDFISSHRSRSPITAHRFKQEICRQKQVIYLHG